MAKRKRFSGEEKAAILREHLVDRVPISDVCEKHGIHPTQFYRWQKALFENASDILSGMSSKGARRREAETNRIEYLEGKLRKKDEVLAELMQEAHRLTRTEVSELLSRHRSVRKLDRLRDKLIAGGKIAGFLQRRREGGRPREWWVMGAG